MSGFHTFQPGLRAWLLLLGALGAAAAQAQSIASTGALSFGSFVAGSGGTVVVGTSGARSKTGGVVLVGQGATASAAQFLVSGTASATYAITLPPDGTVSLSSGSQTMALNGFVSFPHATGTLSAGGSQVLNVGATLSVGANQTPGNYSGSFNVTVQYN
ncbi:MAG: DUF4402 domain-containing protein [Curvibacter sp.]